MARILWVMGWFPLPPDKGVRIRLSQLLDTLAAHHRLTLVVLADPEAEVERYQEELAARCEEVHIFPRREFQPSRWRAIRGFFASAPRWLVDVERPEVHDCVRRLIQERAFDLAIASQLPSALYVRALRGIPKILDEVESGLFLDQVRCASNPLRRVRRMLMWWKYARFLRRLSREFTVCTVVSAVEARILQGIAPEARVAVIPNGIDLVRYQGVEVVPEPDTLIFTGAPTYWANRDALAFFAEAIWPEILRQRPGTRLWITGRMPEGMALPRPPGWIYTGYLKDIRPWVARAWVMVAPLRFGGGTRLKILEAMALGTPVVSTPKGVEGLEFREDGAVTVAADPLDFARAVVTLLNDPKRRARQSRIAREVVRDYDWTQIGEQYLQLVERVLHERDGLAATA
ncbi:MAG TPA: glycosyltransferase [Thermoflexus sp.]|nr:glycosyltransferase [Thermoflexus sp.]